MVYHIHSLQYILHVGLNYLFLPYQIHLFEFYPIVI